MWTYCNIPVHRYKNRFIFRAQGNRRHAVPNQAKQRKIMKVVHVLKRLETIDQDIKDLRKLEKTLTRDKSFTTPIYMSIEKQINILLGEKIKLLELKIDNPPAGIAPEAEEDIQLPQMRREEAKPAPSKKKPSGKAKVKKEEANTIPDDFDDDLALLTQDKIDEKIKKMESETKKSSPGPSIHNKPETASKEDSDDDNHVKLLDIALEKGSLNKSEIEKEKKKVRFFRDNFPGSEY